MGSLALAWVVIGAANAVPAAADSTRVSIEVGAGADHSNLVFYEQSFDSTAFSERMTVSDPETRVGALALLRVVGARGALAYTFSNEARAGDALLRNLARAGIAWAPGGRGRVALDVEADGRRDTSFGVRREDLRLGATASARLATLDRMASARLSARGERVRGTESGGALALFPDFDYVRAGVDVDRMWGTAGTLALGYGLGARSFPDTTERDYTEHVLAANALVRLGGRAWFDVLGDASRRVARRDSAFGDRLWQGEVEGRLAGRAGERIEIGVRSRLRATRYDEPTPTFFDSRFLRHAVFLRRRADSGLEFELRPEIEFARTPQFGRLPPSATEEDRRAVAGEEYDEVAVRLEVERFGSAGWWTLAPAVGWRTHSRAARASTDLSSRSDYWFAEVSAFADRRLAGGPTLRFSGDARLEQHQVPEDDARSLSVAAELRVPLR